MSETRIRVLSLGAGVQSSTLALMVARGELPPVNAAIFADTHHEPQAVYHYLGWLESVLPYPVYRVSAGDLWTSATRVRTKRDGSQTYIATGIPFYTVDGLKSGIGKRQCTRDFKVTPVTRKVQELLGLKRITKKQGILADMLIGISWDERDRMKPSTKPWIQTKWPLVDLAMTREDCLEWLAQYDYPTPARSACTFCPFRSDDQWLALTRAEFADAVEKEKQLQAAYARASSVRAVPYLHDARIPLDQVRLVPPSPEQRAKQLNYFRNECSGHCGV